MTIEEKIDTILAEIDKHSLVHLPGIFEENFGNFNEGRRDYNIIKNTLETEGFIEPSPKRTGHSITGIGSQIVQQGGYLAYLKRKEEREGKVREREQLEVDLAESNLQSNKVNRRFSRLNFIFLVANLLIALYTIYNGTSNSKETEPSQVVEKPKDVQDDHNGIESKAPIDSVR